MLEDEVTVPPACSPTDSTPLLIVEGGERQSQAATRRWIVGIRRRVASRSQTLVSFGISRQVGRGQKIRQSGSYFFGARIS